MGFNLPNRVDDSLDPEKNTVSLIMKGLDIVWEPNNPDIRWLGMAAHYLNITSEGRHTPDYKRTGQRYPCYGGAVGPFLIVNNPYRYPAVDEWRLPYLDWLANGSPFASIFLTKNPEAIDKYGAILDWDKHRGLAFGGAIAMRTLHEHADKGVIWWALVKAGVEPTFAYMVALANVVDGYNKDSTIESVLENRAYACQVSHGGVDPNIWGNAECIRWLKKEPLNNGRAADRTFNTGASPSLWNTLPEGVGTVHTDRWGGKRKSFTFKELLDYWTNNWEKVLSGHFGLCWKDGAYVSIGKEGNGQEPEEDM